MVILELEEVVNKKIEDGKYLVIGIEFLGSSKTNAVIPDKIIVNEHEIHIEGEKLILDITDDEEKFYVEYDEFEEEFVIRQGNVTIYIS